MRPNFNAGIRRFWNGPYRTVGVILAIAGVLFAGSLMLLSQRPRAFIPDFGEVQINVTVDLPNGTTMTETNDAVIEFENAIADVEEVGTIQSEIGSSGGLASMLMGAGSIDQSAATISIVVESTDEVDTLTAEVRQISEDTFGSENVVVSAGALTSGAFGSFALVISGDPQGLADFNEQAIAALEEVEGLTNVTSNLTDTEMILRVDGESALRYTGELETEDSLGVTGLAKSNLESIAPPSLTVSDGF